MLSRVSYSTGAGPAFPARRFAPHSSARSRSSGKSWFVLFIAPSSQALEPPGKTGRFNAKSLRPSATADDRRKSFVVGIQRDIAADAQPARGPHRILLASGGGASIAGIGHAWRCIRQQRDAMKTMPPKYPGHRAKTQGAQDRSTTFNLPSRRYRPRERFGITSSRMKTARTPGRRLCVQPPRCRSRITARTRSAQLGNWGQS